MQSEQEIRQLKEELEKLTGFLGENTATQTLCNEDEMCASTVCDALSWVLEEITTDHFRNGSHLKLKRLIHNARVIERITGNKLANYE